MKACIQFFKSTLINGLLVVLPFGLVIVLIIKIIEMLRHITVPIISLLPKTLHYPFTITAIFLIALCFIVGLTLRVSPNLGFGKFFERHVLNPIPGYQIIRDLISRIAGVSVNDKYSPALVEIEDALVPAFVVESHPDDKYTVFVPSAPTPGVGAIYIISKQRVHLLDVSLLQAVKCISQWGAGSGELLKTMKKL